MSEEIIDTGIVEDTDANVSEPLEPELADVDPTQEHTAPVEPEPTPEVVEALPTPTPQYTEPVAVSGNNVDEVYLAKCVYKNKFERKSLTVHHLQRRLQELGYSEAASDKDGYLGDLTLVAIEKFQKDKGLPVGKIDEDTFSSIFQGDPHVHVNL